MVLRVPGTPQTPTVPRVSSPISVEIATPMIASVKTCAEMKGLVDCTSLLPARPLEPTGLPPPSPVVLRPLSPPLPNLHAPVSGGFSWMRPPPSCQPSCFFFSSTWPHKSPKLPCPFQLCGHHAPFMQKALPGNLSQENLLTTEVQPKCGPSMRLSPPPVETCFSPSVLGTILSAHYLYSFFHCGPAKASKVKTLEFSNSLPLHISSLTAARSMR